MYNNYFLIFRTLKQMKFIGELHLKFKNMYKD